MPNTEDPMQVCPEAFATGHQSEKTALTTTAAFFAAALLPAVIFWDGAWVCGPQASAGGGCQQPVGHVPPSNSSRVQDMQISTYSSILTVLSSGES